MAAFNWIEIDSDCPSCKKRQRILCQTHVASSFDGDESGRFCHRTFRLGERMPWTADDGWKEGGRPRENPAECAEACYSECKGCFAQLAVVILFREATPVEVLCVREEANWPEGFRR